MLGESEGGRGVQRGEEGMGCRTGEERAGLEWGGLMPRLGGCGVVLCTCVGNARAATCLKSGKYQMARSSSLTRGKTIRFDRGGTELVLFDWDRKRAG